MHLPTFVIAQFVGTKIICHVIFCRVNGSLDDFIELSASKTNVSCVPFDKTKKQTHVWELH